MRQEQYKPQLEIELTLLKGFATTFLSRSDMYALQRPDGNYVAVHKPLDASLLSKHLRGQLTLGAYALDTEDRAKWICLDADQQEHWLGLTKLAQDLQQQGIVPYLEQSRRGGHLWLFTSPLPGIFARRFGKALVSEYSLNSIEINPKQDRLSTGPGSLVRLPLGKHQLTGKIYPFITLEGIPIAPTPRQQLNLLASPTLVPLAFILRQIAKLPVEKQSIQSPTPQFQPDNVSTGHTLSERLKSRMSVLDFVSQYVALDTNHTGFCPFHDDQTPSFSVHVEGNYWNCFAGCGGGSIIDFWMQWRSHQGQDGSFTATVKDLRSILL